MLTGRLAPPVSAVTVIRPLAPTLTVATANAPVPVAPGMFTIPVLPAVAPSATMSGTGVGDADKSSVFTPVMTAGGTTPLPAMANATSVGSRAATGVIATTKLCAAPGGMSIAVLGLPVG